MTLRIRKRKDESSFRDIVDIYNEETGESFSVPNVTAVELSGFENDAINKINSIRNFIHPRFDEKELTPEEISIRYGYLLSHLYAIRVILGEAR